MQFEDLQEYQSESLVISKIDNLFYKNPPLGTIPINDFNLIAYERLQILHTIELIGLRNSKNTQVYYDALDTELRKIRKGLISKFKNLSNFPEEFRDQVSHFILRLCYCKTDDLRKWFINNEVEYFKYKMNSNDSISASAYMEAIMDQEKLNYKPVSYLEKDNILKLLINSTHKSMHAKLKEKDTDILKVPFIEISELIRKRKVYLNDGWAYVPKFELTYLIVRRFKIHLSYVLAYSRNYLASIKDKRILALIEGADKIYLGAADNGKYQQKITNLEKITSEDINKISESFPICMVNLQQNLMREHKLKHGGRMQFGLFLKGIGLPIDEALKFWQKEFCKSMPPETFQKQYSYGIRHIFGKEGKKADYTPFSCIKIIMNNNPGIQDFHGCPFKHMDQATLKSKIRQNLQTFNKSKISDSQIEEIMNLSASSHFQIACSKHFAYKHDIDPNKAPPINHPNQYFEESRKILLKS